MAYLLEKYRELAYRAHTGTSFFPEKRAEAYIKDYSEQLENDLTEVNKLGGDADEYRTKYEAKFSAWMRAKGNCLSSMIAGPSNFPVRRAEQANRTEELRYKEFEQFRENFIKMLRRNQRREAQRNSDPIQELRAKIEHLEAQQELMGKANKIIRTTIDHNHTVHSLEQIGITGRVATELLLPDFMGRKGFPDYQLKNNGANIRRLKERLAALEKKQNDGTFQEEHANKIRVVHNTEDDRLQIFFPEKPDAATIQVLKSKAFKWSPKNGCWQRQITDNAKWALAQILEVL